MAATQDFEYIARDGASARLLASDVSELACLSPDRMPMVAAIQLARGNAPLRRRMYTGIRRWRALLFPRTRIDHDDIVLMGITTDLSKGRGIPSLRAAKKAGVDGMSLWSGPQEDNELCCQRKPRNEFFIRLATRHR